MTRLIGDDLDKYRPQLVQKWLKKSPFPNIFSEYRCVFIPCNYKEMHWALIMIDFSN